MKLKIYKYYYYFFYKNYACKMILLMGWLNTFKSKILENWYSRVLHVSGFNCIENICSELISDNTNYY